MTSLTLKLLSFLTVCPNICQKKLKMRLQVKQNPLEKFCDEFCFISAGIKAPSVTNHNATKSAASGQPAAKTTPAASHLTKQTSQYPLQRSGSARLSRLHSAGEDV